MSQIQRALRACADTKVTPLTPHWADDARRLMRQAADALDAAEEVMAEHRSQSPAEGDENSIAMAWNTIRAEARKLSGCHFGLSDLLTAVEQYGDRRAAQAKVQPKGTEPPGWVCPELTPESMTDLAVAIGELSQAMGSPCVMGRAPQTIKSQTVRLAAFRLKEAQAPAPADDQWRDAVDQQLILCELTVTNFATPSDAVRGLLDWHAMVAREVCSASPAPAPEHVPVSPEHEAAPAHQDYVLSLLVAAGHVTQAKVDEAREIAAKVAPAPSPAVGAEPVATFQGRRLTPEGTSEFWGWLRGDPSSDPPVGALLYTAPPPPESPCQFALDGSGNLYRRYGKPVCASCVPAAKETDKWESARVADFNAGWNACRTAMLAASQPPVQGSGS